MKPVYLQHEVDCPTFGRFVHAWQDGELAGVDAAAMASHAAKCARCRFAASVETAFADALRRRLAEPDGPSPALRARVRQALREEADGDARTSVRVRPGAVLAGIAAAAILAGAILLVPGRAVGPAIVEDERNAVVVDLLCDQAGVDLAAQRGCRDARHLNVLRLEDGSYWSILVDDPASRAIVHDPTERGRHLTVRGRFYPSIRTVAVERFREVVRSRRATATLVARAGTIGPARGGS